MAKLFDDAPTDTLLRWAIHAFAPGISLATSFGPQSIVLMHQISQLRPTTDVFYLDTGLLFPQTYALRDELAQRLNLRFTRVAGASLEQQEQRYGPRLWEDKPDLCCQLRKVQPLQRYLRGRQAWITGIRNEHNQHRANAPLVQWDGTHQLVKINPLARWTVDQVWDYLRQHDLPFNSLHEQGYPSIGCQPCTRAVTPGEDPRAGRWSGREKTECGIHGHLPLLKLPGDAQGSSQD